MDVCARFHPSPLGRSLKFVQVSSSRPATADGTVAGVATTHVVVVEGHVLLAESLTLALAERGLTTSALGLPFGTADPAALLKPILALHPSVVLLNPDLGPTGDGMVLVGPLRRAGCPVVVVTAAEDRSRWGEALALGAHSTLPESAGLDQVLEALRRATAGEPMMDDVLRLELVQYWRGQQLRNERNRARLDLLTPREREVLALLAAGKRVRDIARHFQVSEATVRTQVKSVLSKMRVNSQIAAIAITRELGWRLPS